MNSPFRNERPTGTCPGGFTLQTERISQTIGLHPECPMDAFGSCIVGFACLGYNEFASRASRCRIGWGSELERSGRPTSLQSRRRRYSIGAILKGIAQTIVPIPPQLPGNPFASARISCIGHGAENITIPGRPVPDKQSIRPYLLRPWVKAKRATG